MFLFLHTPPQNLLGSRPFFPPTLILIVYFLSVLYASSTAPPNLPVLTPSGALPSTELTFYLRNHLLQSPSSSVLPNTSIIHPFNTSPQALSTQSLKFLSSPPSSSSSSSESSSETIPSSEVFSSHSSYYPSFFNSSSAPSSFSSSSLSPTSSSSPPSPPSSSSSQPSFSSPSSHSPPPSPPARLVARSSDWHGGMAKRCGHVVSGKSSQAPIRTTQYGKVRGILLETRGWKIGGLMNGA